MVVFMARAYDTESVTRKRDLVLGIVAFASYNFPLRRRRKCASDTDTCPMLYFHTLKQRKCNKAGARISGYSARPPFFDLLPVNFLRH